MTPSPRREFWREYWSHHRLRYPEDAREGWADSNVRHPTARKALSISLYLMRERNRVGIYMVESHLDAPERLETVERYLPQLRMVLADPTQSNYGGTHLEVDVDDRANWNAMREWLHHRKIIYQVVIREVEGNRG